MSRLHGFNVLRSRLLHCLCYPELSLGNGTSNPNAAAIMLLWSKLTRIFTLGCSPQFRRNGPGENFKY